MDHFINNLSDKFSKKEKLGLFNKWKEFLSLINNKTKKKIQ